MTFFGPSSLIEKVEQVDTLEFRITSVLRGYHLLIAGLVGETLSTWKVGFWWGLLVGLVVAGGWYLLHQLDGQQRVLRVTETTLEASGPRYGPDNVRWSRVMRLVYTSSGEDGPSGLAAKTGRMDWVWLVQDVSPAEANEMIDAIFRKFPFVNMADEPPGLLESWFDGKGAPQKLF